MAGSAVWLDVLPSMAKFGSTMSKQAGTAARAAGVSAGRQFSAGISAGGSAGAAKTLVAQLETASKRATKAIQAEKVAIAKARADESAAAKGVQAAEARLAEQRRKYTATSSQALKAEQQLAVARGRQQTTALKTVAVEDQLKAAFSEQKAVTGQLAAAQASGSKQTALMQSRFGRLAAAGAPLSAGLGKVAQGAKNVAANALATLKPLAGLAAGFGAIVGIGRVISLGNEYTKTMNELQAVTNASGKQMLATSKTARALGSDLTLPATSGADAAAIMVELAKGGLSLQGSMDAAKGTIQLAAAAQVDGATAAEIQANALNQFSLSADKAGMVADVLANTANAAAGGVTDIATSMKYVGPVAASLGISLADTASSIGLLANQGLKGDTAGTALRGMLASLARPSKQAQKGVDALGLSVFDSQGKFVGMRAVIESLSEAQKTMTQEQFATNAVLAFGREPLAAVNALARQGAKGYDQMSSAVGRQGGAAAVAQSQMKGLGGAMDKLESQLEDVALGIYQTVTPALTAAVTGIAGGLDGAGSKVQKFLDIAGGIGKLAFTGKVSAPIAGIDPKVIAGIQTARTIVVDAFRDIQSFVTQSLIPALKNTAAAVAPVAAIVGGVFLLAFRAAAAVLKFIGPALVGITGFFRDNQVVTIALAGAMGGLVLAYKAFLVQQKIAAAGGLVTWAKNLRIVAAAQKAWTFATWLATGAQRALNLVMRANPIVLIVTALAGLVAGVIWAYKNLGWFKTAVDAVWTGIKVGAKAVGDAFVWLWTNGIKPAVDWIAQAATWLWTTVLQPVFNAISVVVRAIAAVFTWWWQNITMPVFRGIAAAATWMWNTVSAVFDLAIAMIKFALAPVFTFLGAVAKIAWAGIVGAVKWAWGLISTTFNVVVGFIRGTLGVAFSWLYTAVVKPVFAWITQAVQLGWIGMRVVFSAIWTFIRNVLGPVFTWLWQRAIQPAWAGIKLAVKVVWDWLKPVFDKVADVAKNTIPSAFNVMKDGVAKAWNAVKSAAKVPIKFVVDTVVNDALIGNFNKVAKVFGTKTISPISLPKGFAGGGVIPGYSSVKRDDHLRPMRSGEGVLVPEVVKALGPGFVHGLNHAGNSGGVGAVRNLAGYAKGGIVGAATAGWDWVKGTAGKAWDWGKNAAETAANVVADPAGTLGKLVKGVIGSIPGAGRMVDMAGGMASKVTSAAIDALKKLGESDGPATGKNGELSKASLAKVTGFTGGPGVGAMGGFLRKAAARAWESMQSASGKALTLTEGYRDIANQNKRWAMFKAGGNLAAVPGTSVHGLGNAADIGAGQAWARANGPRFGWYPTGLSFSQREPWHFEYKGGSGAVAKAAGPTLYDKGGVIPRGTSLIQNNLRDPEVALPLRKLESIVAGSDTRRGGDTHWHITEAKDTDGLVKEVTRRQNLGLV